MKTFWMFVYWARRHGNNGQTSGIAPFRAPRSRPRKRRSLGRFVRDGSLAAKLTLTLENFDLDCFYWDGFTFVSEKMRQRNGAWPLRHPIFRRRCKRVRPAAAIKKLSNHACSGDGGRRRSRRTRTMFAAIVRMVPSSRPACPLSLVFRRDAEPTHEIFYDKFFKIIYCTDEFALRVLRAGCSGALFFDPSHPSGNDIRLRTLRGVEKIAKWTREVFRTKLIEEIA